MGAQERLIDSDTRGDPATPLRWTCKSTRALAAQLTRHRHPISHVRVAQLLHAQGYSLQGNRKTQEGRRLYPAAKDLLITADAGGSNGARLRLWKRTGANTRSAAR